MQSDQIAEGPDLTAIRQRLSQLLDAEDVEERGLVGCVITEYQRCNKPTCRCRRGLLHGPYFYWYGRAFGITWKRYLKREDAPRVKALCELHRSRQYTRARLRAIRRELRQSWRELARLLDEHE
jgi:hypothetical protein